MVKSLRLISWFAVLNLPLALYYSTFFAPDFNKSSAGVLMTFAAAAIGLFFIYFLLGGLIFLFVPALLKKKWGKGFIFYGVIIALLLQIVLAVDAHVFSLYRFHVNLAMLDLFVNGGGQIISFSTATILSIVLEVVVLLFFSAAAVILAFSFAKKSRKVIYFAVIAISLYLGANLVHAFASAKAVLSITEIANRLPVYKPLTMNSFLIKVGYITEDDIANRKVHVGQSGFFKYPKEKLQYAPVEKKLNVLWLAIDTLRYDAFTKDIMPNTYAFSENGYVFNDHYSSSNSTRGGIFGLFYGLPPSYWQVALSAGIPAAIVQATRDQNYALGVFTSATVFKPEFHNTVFVGEKNLRPQSDGNNVFERDADAINDFAEFLGKRKADNKNFFSFIFLDNVHSTAVPEGFKGPFQPAWTTVNHLALKEDTDPTPYFNLYKNSVYYADLNIKKVLDLLKDNGYDENTVIVITSDHGEEFNDNGDNFWGHNSNFTNAQIKIPLIIKWPGKGRGSVDMTTSAYDLTATILPEVFGVTNPISDFSIGQNLFNLKPVNYVLCGSYLENAIVEKDRIVLIDELGMLRFKDKHYNDTDNTARDAYLLDAVRTFSEYLGDK
ncbi:sulfatase-like hydrolase/transferase [Succinatimonas hippei]|uniref:Arylsulfatase n=1 Tax=Succinatimonas hippei (strain DSM 22608 / JCM 16073 / KCTC 15190 / YIT 12066) TaxID=762983 RepID=E8LK60_SUCHY|nr:sulfatase-like hydrolase/transferase [Succinatimonas hippei]EFY07058.1 arylsulfatase [Succinatimonas hippei YIT 12066]MDM8119358.1 sulfatase-like hydrolase/transferase [Succinatimonas hippei]